MIYISYFTWNYCTTDNNEVSEPKYLARQKLGDTGRRFMQSRLSWVSCFTGNISFSSNSFGTHGILQSQKENYASIQQPSSVWLQCRSVSCWTAEVENVSFPDGFHRVSANNCETPTCQSTGIVPPHLPTVTESGLVRVEYNSVITTRSIVAELTDPVPPTKVTRSKYTVYTGEYPGKIVKCALENENMSAITHFKGKFPNLKESTVRNFKKSYNNQLNVLRKRHNPQVLPSKPMERPSILCC